MIDEITLKIDRFALLSGKEIFDEITTTESNELESLESMLIQGQKLIKLVEEREQRTGNALVDLQNKLSPQSKPLLELENLIYKELLEWLKK